ncbi:MAG: hypothetical protein KatS3mg081_1932 [Gemmatimonadales bacterium]|nr:hypothetical protein HRbin33_01293 [bacterium HR33]GIW52577.1 MAG: hypothetical protein KatS3mg081_1932 [Gemmatimonadales bacterium]
MLRRFSSPTPFAGGLVEHECPRCGREVRLPLGALCGECRAQIERKARKLGRWASGISTLLLVVYVLIRLPPDPYARLVSAVGVVVWYLLSNLVVRRAARELLS